MREFKERYASALFCAAHARANERGRLTQAEAEAKAEKILDDCRSYEISARLTRKVNKDAQIALLMNTLEGVIEALESLLGDKLDLAEWNANKALRANTKAEVDAEIASLEEEHSKEAEDGGI